MSSPLSARSILFSVRLTDKSTTENQEKELFTTLAALVTGVDAIQVDVKDLKFDVQVLKSDVREIKETLGEHSQMFSRLEAKTDSIAEVVIRNDKRLTVVENEIAQLKSEVQ